MLPDAGAQAGLLIAETEFALQVESDIAPYKGLLMGLFFMTVGMEISVGLFFAKIRTVLAGIAGLLLGKVLCLPESGNALPGCCVVLALQGGVLPDAQVAVMTALGPLFGLSRIQALRAGLLLAAGGEFAFVAL